ncbi:MAG: DUF4870 domain-containing protein [Planctomycetota bacterium]
MAETNETSQNPASEQTQQPAGAELSGTVQPASEGKELNQDARMWGMFCHLAGVGGLLPVVPVIGSIIVPLIIWQIKKDDFGFVGEHGKEAVNFQISILIYAVVAGVLCFACAGFVLLPAVYIFDFVCLLIAALRANDGQRYRYPLCIRLIK